ncbi:GNAT family N-acetyltransferase [Dongia sp.]|uniref:GNAT family N-acetyltransferase n=1 Tax=Dongia sp. TaxID=1977262 RepID=UPI0035B33F35
MDIRAARPTDLPAIAALHDAAFGTTFEGKLVADLTDADLAAISLVAVEAGRVVGHILFSPLLVEVGGAPVMALALAPLGVLPAAQGKGIGTALIKAGLEEVRAQGWDVVIVLGQPTYYGRFGFSAGPLAGFAGPFEGPAFMALELRPGALSDGKGRIIYPDSFGIAKPEASVPVS